MDIPHNMDFEPTEDGMRERALDRSDMGEGINFLKSELEKQGDELSKADLLYQIGVYCRIVENYAESEESLKAAADIFKEHDKKPMFIAVQLRLATTYAWQQNYTKSDDIYLKIIQKLESMGEKESFVKHKDYAYQHMAKSLMERKRYNDALEMFMKAMELRLQRGDMQLIKATEDMLSIVREKLQEQEGS